MSTRSCHDRTACWRFALISLLIAVAGSAAPAVAATVADAIDQASDGVFVEQGSGQDPSALQAVVADFADREQIVITVFAGGLRGAPEDRAFDVLDGVSAETVVLFTPDDVAVASNIHSRGEVDDAFRRAGAPALDRDAAVAARALMMALTDTPTPLWVWLLGLAGLMGVVVLAITLLRRRRQQQVADREYAQARAAFQSRLQTVAGLILDLEGPVTLMDDPDLTDDMAAATGVYRDVQWSFERVNRASQIRSLERTLDPAEKTLARLAAKVG